MSTIDLEDVGFIRCTVYDKGGNVMDTLKIKPRQVSKPYPLAQKVLRGAVKLINKRIEHEATKALGG